MELLLIDQMRFMVRLTFLYFIILYASIIPIINAYQAVVIVPIADLISKPFKGTIQEIYQQYDELPISGDSCARAHQLLLHEIVDVLAEHNGQVCVALSHRFYVGNGRDFSSSIYWMRKDQLISLQQLTDQSIDGVHLPDRISYQQNNITQANRAVVSLVSPWRIGHTTYSAGTRFNIHHTSSDSYFVWYFDHLQWRIIKIPRSYGFVYKNQSIQERLALFVDRLKNWACEEDGIIPYVWGGCSFCYRVNEYNFTTSKTAVEDGEDVSVILMHPYSKPYAGLDCSGLIARVAQIYSLPYYYKNTDTLALFLEPVQTKKALKEGDLLWFEGHVMIISDIKHDKILEARGYGSGFGCIHEKHLRQLFLNISTYDELWDCYIQHLPLKLADSQGNLRFKIDAFSLFKLA
jgi:hypothetical protein